MYTAAEIIKNTRIDRQYSLEEVSKNTKIPIKYLEAIENFDYQNYPAEPYCSLFVSKYAHFLGLESDKITSLFRRDNSQQKNQSKRHSKSAIYFTPQFLFTTTTVLVVLFMFFFLLTRYLSFNKAPDLSVVWPNHTTQSHVRISGTTDPNCTVRVNQDLVIVDPNGGFSKQIDISQTSMVTIESTSPSGKKTIKSKDISQPN